MRRFSIFSLIFGALLGGLVVSYNNKAQANESGNSSTSTSKPGFEPTAPHGGVLVTAGDDFAHVEMVFDSKSGTLTAYILDGEAEEVVPLKQPILVVRLMNPAKTLKLKAVISPLSGEKSGETSSYAVTDPSLKGTIHIQGVLVWININGQIFRDLAFQFPPVNESSGS
jgi:hypothetical protein